MAVPTIQHNTPTSGSITWGDFTIRYLNETFAIGAGSTSDRWVWWEYRGGGANSIITSGMDIPPTLTDDDIVLFGNKNGTGIRVQASTFVDGELIVDGTILSQAISTTGLDAAHIKFGTMSGERIEANTLTIGHVEGLGFTDTETGVTTIDGGKIAANTVNADAISAGYVYGGTVKAEQISTGDLSAKVTLTGSITAGDPLGARVQMNNQGIRVYDATNEERTVLDSNGTSTFRGDVEADNLSVKSMKLSGLTNEVSSKAEVTIAAGVTDPLAPPTFANEWTSIDSVYKPWASQVILGIHWNAAKGQWIQCSRNSVSGGGSQVWEVNPDGTKGDRIWYSTSCPTGYTYAGGVQIGSNIYTLRYNDTEWVVEQSLEDPIDNPPVYDSYSAVRMGPNDPSCVPRMTTDGTYLYVAELGPNRASMYVTKLETAAAAGAEMAPNRTFETNVSGWEGAYNCELYWSNDKAADMWPLNDTKYARIQTINALNVTPYKQYDLAAQFHPYGKRTVHADIRWFDSAGTFIKAETGPKKTGSTTNLLLDTVGTAPSNATTCRISLQADASAGEGGLWDNVSLKTSGGLNYHSRTVHNETYPTITGIYVGNGDFGASRYVVATTNRVYSVPALAGGVIQASEGFPVPSGVSSSGIGFNGTNFVTLSSDSRIYTHESTNKSLPEVSRYIGYTWFDSAGTTHETKLSPVYIGNLFRRAKFRVTAPTLPGNGGVEDPDSIRVYVGDAQSTMYLSSTSPPGTHAASFNTLGTTTAAPVANNFAGGTPGVIDAAEGGFVVRGDSSGAWPYIQPVGAITMYVGGAPAPPGWLLCTGGTFSSDDHPALAALLGDKFGIHSGTTYYLPNFTNKFPRGGTPGPGAGSDTVTIAKENLPQHQHGINHNHAAFTSGSEQSHPAGAWVVNSAGTGAFNVSTTNGNAQTSGGGGLHSHNIDIPNFEGDSGTGLSLNNNPLTVTNPYTSVNFIIKT